MNPKTKKRLLIAILIATASGWLSWLAQSYLSRPGGDFLLALTAASDLLAGRDPYGHPAGPTWIAYPLPAALVAMPFSFLPLAVAGGLFFGLSSGLLTFCITKGAYKRLGIFLAMPFWFCLCWAQWAPLIMASAFIPALLPVVLIKPQIALPVSLTHLTRVGIYSCVTVLALSLAVYPKWPFGWLSQIRQYQRFFPILTLPFGPFLLLALFRWRDKDAQLLLLSALLPQRHFYDAFVLWLIPKSAKEIWPTVLISWGAWIWKSYHPNMQSSEIGLVSTMLFFLPMLFVILLRRREKSSLTEAGEVF